MEPYYSIVIPPVLNGPGLENSFLISEILMDSVILSRVIRECRNDKFYHKVTVFAEEEYRRDLILKTLLNFVEPVTFSPVLFKKEGDSCFFFMKSCQDVLLKLITAKFKVKIPNKGEKYLKFRIICNFIPVEVLEAVITDNLSDVLKTRYETSTKNLDLSSFGDDESLLEYLPLHLLGNMATVLTHAANYHPKSLNLRHNDLKNMTSFYFLQKDLESLDLRNNQIQSLEDLACLKYFTKLRSLYLDGNPLCGLYDNFNYIIEVKSLCSSLQFIDGERIVFPPTIKQSCLCRLESKEFADQFMKLFFTQYDSDNRLTLRGFYNENALLSVSSTVVPDQKNSEDIDLNHYGSKDPFLVYGVEEIMKLFQELPKTRHYPHQFTCDVTSYERTNAAISVSGVYWEHKQCISFVRYFWLNRSEENFSITNEQLTVMNATDNQSDCSVMLRYTSDLPYFPSEYGKMELALGQLTNMNREYCQIFLYHCQYDLNKALEVFCESYLKNRIPSDVFADDKTTSNDDVSSFSDLIIEAVSKTSQTISEQSVWKFMEIERLKRSLYYEKVKSSHVKKIYHMRHFQKSASSERSKSSSNSLLNQIETLEKPKKIDRWKPTRFKLSKPSVLRNMKTKRTEEREETITENIEMGGKNKESKNSETVDKSNPKTVRSSKIFSKDAAEYNITSSNLIVSNDAKLQSIHSPSERILKNCNKSKKRKRRNSHDKKETTDNRVDTIQVPLYDNTSPVVQPDVLQNIQNVTIANLRQPSSQSPTSLDLLPQSPQTSLAQQPMNLEEQYNPFPSENVGELTTAQLGDTILNNENSVAPPGTEDVHADAIQSETNENIPPVQSNLINNEVHDQGEGMNGVEKVLYNIIRQLNTDNQTVREATEVSINCCVKRMLSFIERLETSYKINGGNRTLKEPVMIKKIIPMRKEVDLAFSILHVILHEMFEYESCKYDHTKINVNISDEILLCSNKIYLSHAELLNNIRKKLYQNQNVFGILRFKREPSPVECDMKNNQITLPPLLLVHNKFDIFYEILKNSVDDKEAEHGQKLDLIKNIAQYVWTYFADSTNILAKRRLDLEQIANNSIQKGMKGVFMLTEALVHIIIHEFIENSTCINNKSKDFLKNTDVPPMCHNTIYQPQSENILTKIRCLLRQAELKHQLRNEGKQEIPKMPSDVSLVMRKEPMKRHVPFTEVFNDVLKEICSRSSIGTQQAVVKGKLLVFAGFIASLVKYLDNNEKKRVSREFLNAIVRLLEKQEPVNHNPTSPKRFLINLTKSIIHVTIHEMFEYKPCTGNAPRCATNENVLVEKLLCQDDIYQKKNEHLRMLIRECLSKVEHHFKNLKLNAQPFSSVSPIYDLVEAPSVPVPQSAEVRKAEDNSNQRIVEDDSCHKKANNSNHNKEEDNSHHIKAKINLSRGVPTAQMLGSTISKESPTPSISTIKIPNDEVTQLINYIEKQATKPLENVVNLKEHLLGKNVNKSIIMYFLKLIAHQTSSWPDSDSQFQATIELLDLLADSFILNIQDLTGNSTIENASELESTDDGTTVSCEVVEPEIEVVDLCEPDPTMSLADVDTNDSRDCEIVEPEVEVIDLCELDSTMPVPDLQTNDEGDCEIIEPKIEVIDLCGPSSSRDEFVDKRWINSKLRRKYDTLAKGFDDYYRSCILKLYTGLLHVVMHEILEKSTCDSTHCKSNESENSDIRSVICTDSIYKFKQKLEKIRKVLYEGENILQSGSIPSKLKENIIVLSPKLTFLFGFVPEKTLNLEVYLLKGIFIYIIGKCLIKYFDHQSYPTIWHDLDELAEKMTFVMQHYYNLSLNKEGYSAIGPFDAALHTNTSPYLFNLFVGMLDVIGSDFTIFGTRLSNDVLIHQKLSVGSCYLPVGKVLRHFVSYILFENRRILPSWLKFEHGHNTFLQGSPTMSTEIIRDVIVRSSILHTGSVLTPLDSSLVNYFAEKIYCFLKSNELSNLALPITNSVYNYTGIIFPQNGPPCAEIITKVSQILMHILAYHSHEGKIPKLNYKIAKFYKNSDKKLYQMVRKCFPSPAISKILTANFSRISELNTLKTCMMENWKSCHKTVPEKHLKTAQRPAKPVVSKKKRKLTDEVKNIPPKKLKSKILKCK